MVKDGLCGNGTLRGLERSCEANKEKGFSITQQTSDGPIYCIWKTKEGITAEEFQEFIDGPEGPRFGLNALMNI